MANNKKKPEDESTPQPIPLVERWAQDDMKGTKIYASVEEYLKAKRSEKKKGRTVKLGPR